MKPFDAETNYLDTLTAGSLSVASVLAMYEALQEILRIVIALDDPGFGWRDQDATAVDQQLACIWRRAADALGRVTNEAKGGE